MTKDKLIKNFTRCKDWEERYLYLIELGNRYSTLDDTLQSDERLVSGCQSKVWLDIRVEQGVIKIAGSSDTAIVKGMVGLLIILVNEQPIDAIKQAQLEQFFLQIGLQESLTPVRNQGLAAMIAFLFKRL